MPEDIFENVFVTSAVYILLCKCVNWMGAMSLALPKLPISFCDGELKL